MRENGVEGIKAAAEINAVDTYADGIETLHLVDGRKIHILGGGHMANLAGPRPLGNSIEAMDLGFALQARCLERVASGKLNYTFCVVPVPVDIDAQVAPPHISIVKGKPPNAAVGILGTSFISDTMAEAIASSETQAL